MGNVWGVNLNDMILISKYNKETRSSLCVISLRVISNYAWVIPLSTTVKNWQKHLKRFSINQVAKRRKYNLINMVPFPMDQQSYSCKIIVLRFISQIINVINCMLYGKGMIIYSIVGLMQII